MRQRKLNVDPVISRAEQRWTVMRTTVTTQQKYKKEAPEETNERETLWLDIQTRPWFNHTLNQSVQKALFFMV
ncbi:hypothetical protein A2V80_02765 [Candidatus Woesebacteria bacterium RBG_16_39_8b]|uniref:Uncharacterized protein n=1 Tax=Candidatus Woesebacteria bacterium RBG_16_39_8b TaxID=1802482 RepID=A0A1F7XAF4_9BACT|nr:MAG: hypothetical protein A2V80_02765 [Candidatus Woesebacteria bacterium RBG_16_39_8b]